MRIQKNHTFCFSRFLLFLLATSFLMLTGCKDDENQTPVPGGEDYGQERRIELAADLSSKIPTGEISFRLIYNRDTPLAVKAIHSIENGKSVFYLDSQLRVGRYILASIIHKTSEEIFSEANVGCALDVSTRSNAVSPSTFDKLAGYFGTGTVDDPYRIASSTGFDVMRKLIEDGNNSFEGKYFLQTADINMVGSYNKGFRPIAHQQAFPFKGCYDGGGHTISYCAIRTLDSKEQKVGSEVHASGLFGYACGATFRNVTMVDPVSIGANSTGSLVGAVLGTSGEVETPTYLDNCRVRKTSSSASEIYGISFVGGLVGGVDAQAVLVMHRCVNENLPVGNRSDGSFVGGLVGGGTINATAIMDSCVNQSSVVAAGSRCTGGLIGGIETANITNCLNKGNVSATHRSALGTGGIAGGLGTSTLAVVQNEGRINGYEGTGGIVGSTVISKSDGSYNDLIITSAHNYGAILGTDNSGGIAGEAQAMMTDCYNEGSVEATGDFAGGLAGYTPTVVINNSYNNGAVDANKFAGGLLARAAYYIVTNSSNLGPVTASHGMAAGILTLGGTTGMINFCTNYASVRGAVYVAGIIAHSGETKSFTKRDFASIVVSTGKGTFKLMKALRTPPKNVSSLKALFKGGKKVVKIASNALDLISAIATPPLMQDISMWDDLYNRKLDVRNEEMIAGMHAKVAAALPTTRGPLAGSEVLPGLVYENSKAFSRSLEGEGDDLYGDAVHSRLADISEQVAKMEQNREIAIAAVNCVLAVAGAIFTGGAATAAIVVCSTAVTTVGILTDRMDNCIEISQCCNFGDINAGENGYGIIAFQGDHLRLHNCFSAGAASGYGVADTALDGLDDVKPRRIISIGTMNQDPFKSGAAVANQGLFFLVDNKGSHGSRIGYCFADDLARKSTYTNTESPFDFDNTRAWSFQSPIVPLPYNNLYYSFR
ncbi:hypothetical protein DWX23_06170 [Parabacteroides sp. AF18-52]|jgi:putative GLUG domain protein|uniref:hypothetical protein n=1 Tax=Parabacteroides TaxID=375288 RepID=UPI000EFF261D|nr:hypothetical protein [Parabacteroides sp. AF18-52]RHR42117.1 hypothetical protein DWX23_06170 [Parabacteroides sp. AF18-52]